jgi:hypothetical protein
MAAALPVPAAIPSGDFRGEKRGNETHASATDPDARLYREAQGQPARLCHMSHLPIENRHGLIVDAHTTHAIGRAEREAAEAMVGQVAGDGRITLGSDKPMTRPSMSRRCARSASPRTWRRTFPADARPSTGAPPAIPALATSPHLERGRLPRTSASCR